MSRRSRQPGDGHLFRRGIWASPSDQQRACSGLLTIHQKTLKLEPKATGFVLMWGFARKIDCVAPLGLSAENCRNPGLAGLLPNVRTAAPLLSRGGVAARQRESNEATLARADGVVLIRIMIFLTSTTPAAATASAFPSSAEEGSCDSRVGKQPRQPWA